MARNDEETTTQTFDDINLATTPEEDQPWVMEPLHPKVFFVMQNRLN